MSHVATRNCPRFKIHEIDPKCFINAKKTLHGRYCEVFWNTATARLQWPTDRHRCQYIIVIQPPTWLAKQLSHKDTNPRQIAAWFQPSQHEQLRRISEINCANFFLSEYRQISTNFGNFWQKDVKKARIMWDSLNSISPNLCHHTTVLNADVPNCYTTLKVVICNKLSSDLNSTQ